MSVSLVWLPVCLYMFLIGPWKEWGSNHPYLAFFITVFGGPILGNL